MGIIDGVIIGIVVLALIVAIGYVIKAKKNGKKCSGCSGGQCSMCGLYSSCKSVKYEENKE